MKKRGDDQISDDDFYKANESIDVSVKYNPPQQINKEKEQIKKHPLPQSQISIKENKQDKEINITDIKKQL